MKMQILSLALLIGTAMQVSAQRLEVGTTTAVWGAIPTVEQLKQAQKDGVRHIEVAVNQCYRKVPTAEQYPRMQLMKERIEEAGINVWSVHLPFSRTLDISVLNDSLRHENVKTMAQMIRWSCDLYSPQRLVLHSSSEPITEKEREQRLRNAIASIRILKQVADEKSVALCIENLPRTCLGNTPEELVRIVDAVPGVGICFDTNHYFQGTLAHFIDVAGTRIQTVHISDYDLINECHWLPYEGKINWGEFLDKMLLELDYRGVLMHEVKRKRPGNKITTTREISLGVKKMYKEFKRQR